MRAIYSLRVSFGCLLLAMCAGSSFASIIMRTPGNDSIGTAQNLDGFFSLDFNPDIGDALHGPPPVSTNTSTTIPHVTILVPPSSPRPTPSHDFYSFTVPVGAGLTILDVDYAGAPETCPSYFPNCSENGFDSGMFLFDSNGTPIASNDDSDQRDGAGGSFTIGDSFLQLTLASGTYFVDIFAFAHRPLFAGESYALQVSVVGHAIPEPATLLLIVLSLTILIAIRMKSR